MELDIFYNEESDQFSKNLSLEMRIRNYINEHFDIAYTISLLAPVYLVGGAIRDLICAKNPKDLDFVVLGKDNLEWVLSVFDKFDIKYELNRFGGFKFVYKNTAIDLWLSDDLFSAIQYNVDGIFYDLKNQKLLSLTFDDFIKNGLKLVNPDNNIEKGRELKLIEFAKKFK